jgi:hypothetical protein
VTVLIGKQRRKELSNNKYIDKASKGKEITEKTKEIK